MDGRYVKPDENKNIISIDSNNLYGLSLTQPLPYNEIRFKGKFRLNKILKTPDISVVGYYLEVDLSYPYHIRQKTKHFPFCSENNSISKDDFHGYMKRIKPKNYISHNKLFCDRTHKKKYLIHYRVLKFYVRHGMVIDEVQENNII